MAKLNITYVESNIDDDTVESCTFFLDKSEELYCIRSFDNSPSVSTITPSALAIVPTKLARLKQWVNWQSTTRDGKSTKVPTQPTGTPAKPNDSGTWYTWHDVVNAVNRHDGIGFMFSADDGFVGIDLDGCRNPTTGILEPWASAIVERFPNAYVEVSPSKTGVKIFCLSDIQFERGLKYNVQQPNKYGRQPAIEIYAHGRFFTVTGEALPMREGLGDCTGSVRWLRDEVQAKKDVQKSKKIEPMPYAKTWSDAPTDSRVIDRARAYVARMPVAISGQRGHDAAYDVALALYNGFALDERDAWQLLLEYNQVCQPPWSDHELHHKLADAMKRGSVSGRGYLLEGGGNDFSEVHRSQYTDRQTPKPPTSKPPEERVFPPIRSAGQIITDHPNMRPFVIDGMLRRGEIINIIAASKVGKSFLSLGMVFSIATGKKWLGHQMTQGRCLIVDNELHPETMASRLRFVADAMGVDLGSLGVDVLSLRGRLCDLHGLAPLFTQVAGKYSMIVLDAFYRFLPVGTSENDNAQMTQLYNILDAYAAKADASIAVVHHASKGNQAGKEIMDVGAGANSIGRATDSHVIIRSHADDGYYVLEAGIRSSKPLIAKTVAYNWPLWSAVEDVAPVLRDPAAKTQRDRAARREADKSHKDRQDVDFLLSIIPTEGIIKSHLQEKSGWGGDKLTRILGVAQSVWPVVEIARIKRGGRPASKVFRKYLTVDAYLGKQPPIEVVVSRPKRAKS